MKTYLLKKERYNKCCLRKKGGRDGRFKTNQEV
jgi:hypothetical protein